MTVSLNDIAETAHQTVAIAAQNDRFRASWGTDPTVPGRIVATPGAAALGYAALAQVMDAVRQFSDFTEDNDPYGWHDFGAFGIDVEGQEVRLYWKIDLYDTDFAYGTDAPEDPTQTRRVLTILLPSEW